MLDYQKIVSEIRIAACGAEKPSSRLLLMQLAADAIEELIKTSRRWELEAAANEKDKQYLVDENRRLVDSLMNLLVPKWISVEERLPERTNPTHARDTYLVRLESGCIKTLFYEYDNSDRCRPGMSPLFSKGWEKTAVPVTHWMPLPEPPKED